ncbi:MAG: hypothetical protein GOMPHAMPRED_005809 [Gomphillus americanus]|uniref:N-acetyltransferase domain-containing protein n=1 Tax=Gomphillus americanus TaxID=1940652 RepID=A0A8H3FUP8_9LECA|nr:MAG: hypothetical protein GOMPHAMPRED_005809 [Gomphillus americanus]
MASPPKYSAGAGLNPEIRPATASDSEAVSAIHTYYAATSATLNSHGQTPEDIKSSSQVMASLNLPMLVATVPISQIHGVERSEAQTGGAFAATHVRELPLSNAEDKAGERIVGYAVTVPHQMAMQIEGYARTAELYVYVAPRYVYRGVGKALVSTIVDHLRSLGTPGTNGAVVPRWRNLVAIMVARTGGELDDGDPLAGVELGPVDDERQLEVWERLGFEEAGRLKCVLEKGGRWRDVRYFQKDLTA